MPEGTAPQTLTASHAHARAARRGMLRLVLLIVVVVGTITVGMQNRSSFYAAYYHYAWRHENDTARQDELLLSLLRWTDDSSQRTAYLTTSFMNDHTPESLDESALIDRLIDAKQGEALVPALMKYYHYLKKNKLANNLFFANYLRQIGTAGIAAVRAAYASGEEAPGRLALNMFVGRAYPCRWLAFVQEPDGHWNAQKYGAKPQTKMSAFDQNILVSSLSLLAILGNGNSVGFGRYRAIVRKGTFWLMRQQQKDGRIGESRLANAFALAALAESSGMCEDSPLAKQIGVAAQRLVDWGGEAQLPSGGWDADENIEYSTRAATPWWVMGMKDAYDSGLSVPQETLNKAQAYYLARTDARTGHFRSSSGRDGGVSLAAAANACLQFLGEEHDAREVIAGAKYISQKRFMSTAEKSPPDFYLRYFQTFGLFQVSVRSPSWRTCCAADIRMLMEQKLQPTGITANSALRKRQFLFRTWDFQNDPNGGLWGRVGQTALAEILMGMLCQHQHPSPLVGL